MTALKIREGDGHGNRWQIRVEWLVFHRALEQLGIELILAYSPQARGRFEHMFKTWQDRLPRELALAGITTLAPQPTLHQMPLPAGL